MSNIMWSFTALLVSPILLLTSCQQQNPVKSPSENLTDNTTPIQLPISKTDNTSQVQLLISKTDNITLESGFEIPEGIMPQREVTYDDIIDTPGGGIAYRANILDYGTMPKWEIVKHTEVLLDDGFYISYRNYFETKAGQTRTMIFITVLPGIEISKNYAVKLKLAYIPNDFQVRKIEQSTWYLDRQVLTIEIPPQLKPADYKLGFFIFINGKYYGDLPCTIHVIE